MESFGKYRFFMCLTILATVICLNIFAYYSHRNSYTSFDYEIKEKIMTKECHDLTIKGLKNIRYLKTLAESIELPTYSKEKIIHALDWEHTILHRQLIDSLGEEMYQKLNIEEKK